MFEYKFVKGVDEAKFLSEISALSDDGWVVRDINSHIANDKMLVYNDDEHMSRYNTPILYIALLERAV